MRSASTWRSAAASRSRKTLSNIGQCYARLGDLERGLAYLRRAREAHERYGDQDARADTLLCTAEILLEAGDVAAADTLVGDAGALDAVTGSAYDSVHEKILRALLARAGDDPGGAVMYAFDARQAAEAQAYVAFHFYAMAVEAAARVDIGEHHTGILLATTALGAIETIQGSEYGLATRGALRRGAGKSRLAASRRSCADARVAYVSKADQRHSRPRAQTMFLQRPFVRKAGLARLPKPSDAQVSGASCSARAPSAGALIRELPSDDGAA